MKSFLNYLFNYTMQAMIIMQLIWFLILVLYVSLAGLDMTWIYIKAFYPQPSFIVYSLGVPFIVALTATTVRSLVLNVINPARPFNR